MSRTVLFVCLTLFFTGCREGVSLPDGGVIGLGSKPDARPVAPAPMGTVGPGGGSVTRLFFAVVGDTRPANYDDTAHYPTAIIQKIYADIQAMVPRPQFVVTTGDYMFANPYGAEGATQMAIYQGAAQQFSGSVFAAMGNHECTGATASNCAARVTNNYNVWFDALVKPLGKTTPYYTIPVDDAAGQWTAKLVIAACNAWDTTQKDWLAKELAKPTTYTFVIRHQPSSAQTGPCVPEMDALLLASPYNLLIVGHSHTFAHLKQEVIIGNGGAPLTGGTSYGYATIDQQPGGGFAVTEYEYLSAMPVGSFTIP